VDEDEDEAEFTCMSFNPPDVAPAADQPNDPQQELMTGLNMVPFFEM
jgi:hypothetical protein